MPRTCRPGTDPDTKRGPKKGVGGRTIPAPGQKRRVEGPVALVVEIIEPSYLHPNAWFCRNCATGKGVFVFNYDLGKEVS